MFKNNISLVMTGSYFKHFICQAKSMKVKETRKLGLWHVYMLFELGGGENKVEQTS